MKGETPFIETEALMLALRGIDESELTGYLDREFLPGELRSLSDACDRLGLAARKVARRKSKPSAGSEGSEK